MPVSACFGRRLADRGYAPVGNRTERGPVNDGAMSATFVAIAALALGLTASGEMVEQRGIAEFERLQPNGANCEPVCWQAVVRV